MTAHHTSGINLLPWRRMKRDQAKKKIKLYGVFCLTFLSTVVLITYCYVTQMNHKKVLCRSNKQAVAQKHYQSIRKLYKEQFRNTTAKLEHQSLDSLHFIGLLNDGAKTWGLLGQSDGMVSIVVPGDYLGKEHGRVMRIKEDVIDIEKTVWSKQGVKKKWIVLHLR